MKKIKICGVSLCTLLAATGANAAGYTCEELIEYTSCMSGYYLNTPTPTCPAGYGYVRGACDSWDEGIEKGYTAEECMDYWCDGFCDDPSDYADKWMGDGCYMGDWDEEGDWVEDFIPKSSTAECLTCPTGYTCDGGTTRPYVGACDAGYTKHMCPTGTSLKKNVCNDSWLGLDVVDSEEDCDGDFYSSACVTLDVYGDMTSVAEPLVAGPTCGKCPAGYLCSGGDAAAVTCPAGSYCADAGLSSPSGECNIGTYSAGGATMATCTPCPTTGLKDKDGNTVVATTAEKGSTSAAACHVGRDVEFKDIKGIYRFKSNCSYDVDWDISNATHSERIARCEELGGTYGQYSDMMEDEYIWYCVLDDLEEYFTDNNITTEEACDQLDSCSWDSMVGDGCYCECDDGEWTIDLVTGVRSCVSDIEPAL